MSFLLRLLVAASGATALFSLVSAAAKAEPPPAPPTPEPPPDLADYVRKPDPSFASARREKTETPQGTVHHLHLVSQTWQGMKWEHGLQVFVPTGAKPKGTMLLWNTGGEPNPASALLGLHIAGKVGAPVAFLYGVPNQPLFGGKKEDALIAETFVRYLATKDPTWPLLFPMAKSVTAAMTALQAFATEEWKYDVTHFVVSGASKRGWTSWMTAASGDPRVKGIAPMVFDTLNMHAQMPHQLATMGGFSRMIHDYTDRKLVPLPDTPEAKRLWAMVDPWVYRKKLTLPKLIVNGTNDQYWATDALNLYWDDLPGEKHVVYVPNAGHGLDEERESGAKSRDRAVNALAAFTRSLADDKPLPKLEWKQSTRDGLADLRVTSDVDPKTVRIWTATAQTRDFRKARWMPSCHVMVSGDAYIESVLYPDSGYTAFFAEAEYERDGLTFYLSTQLRVVGGKK